MKLAVIVPLFNYANSLLLEQNHRMAVDELNHEPEVDVYTLRAVLGEPTEFRLLFLRGESVLWQKEALVNAGIKRFCTDYDAVAWIDSGILLSCGWAARTLRALETHDAVQCYDRGVWLGEDGCKTSTRAGYIWYRERYHPGAWQIDPPRGPKPSVGGAWAARTKLLRRLPLYDRNVVGGGDTWWLNGVLHVNTPEALVTRHLTPKHRADVCRWINRARAMELRVGWLPGEYTHLWHAEQVDRRHWERHQILVRHGYDPQRYTRLNADGLVEWTTEAPPVMSQEVQEFLLGRAPKQAVSVPGGP